MDTGWFRRAVIYHVLIDRFAGYGSTGWDKPDYCGGTLRGIIDKLGYIKELGVDALYLSPFYAGTAYHGYHIIDFYSVDPHFGTETDFRDLAATVHAAGMRLIIDVVPNHVSRYHPFFIQAAKDPSHEYRSWFFFTSRSGGYRSFLDVTELPKLNLDHPEARDHVIGAVLYWLERGADGLRIDHAVGPSVKFSRALYQAVKRARPDAVIFAEAWLPHPPLRLLPTVTIPWKYIRFFTRRLTQERLQRDWVGVFDGVLDFYVRNVLVRYGGLKKWSKAVEHELLARLHRHYRRYPASFFLPAFLDNHDTNRFYFECGHDRSQLVRMLTILFSLPQPVIIYYGTESGLSQETPLSVDVPYADLHARRVMNWETPDRALTETVKELVLHRRSRQKEILFS